MNRVKNDTASGEWMEPTYFCPNCRTPLVKPVSNQDPCPVCGDP